MVTMLPGIVKRGRRARLVSGTLLALLCAMGAAVAGRPRRHAGVLLPDHPGRLCLRRALRVSDGRARAAGFGAADGWGRAVDALPDVCDGLDGVGNCGAQAGARPAAAGRSGRASAALCLRLHLGATVRCVDEPMVMAPARRGRALLGAGPGPRRDDATLLGLLSGDFTRLGLAARACERGADRRAGPAGAKGAAPVSGAIPLRDR